MYVQCMRSLRYLWVIFQAVRSLICLGGISDDNELSAFFGGTSTRI